MVKECQRVYQTGICPRASPVVNAVALTAVLLHTEGNFHEDVLIRYIMSLQYQTIFLGESSLLARLKADFPVCSE